MTTTRRLALLAVAALLVVAIAVLAVLWKPQKGEAALGPRQALPGRSALIEPTGDLDRVAAEAAESDESESWIFEPEESASIAVQIFDGTRIQVLIDDVAAATGWVDLYEQVTEADGSTRYDPRSEPIGLDGIASFKGLRLVSGKIDVRLPGGEPLRASVTRRRDPSTTIVVRLGTAHIIGRVWRSDGRPAAGVHVSASVSDLRAEEIDPHGRLMLLRLEGSRKTDSDGSFAVNHLPAGRCYIRAAPDDDFGMTQQVELARGEVREVDLGSPSGLVTLQGRLLDAVGEPITPFLDGQTVGQLRFVSLEGEARSVSISAESAYRVSVSPGTYSVRLTHLLRNALMREREVHASLVVSADATVDFSVPGARVSGTVTVAGSVHRFDPEYDGQWTKLLLKNVLDKWGMEEMEVLVDRRGRYVFHGVGPGRWQLSGKRLMEPEPIEVLVSEGDRDIVLDVIVRPRQVPNR